MSLSRRAVLAGGGSALIVPRAFARPPDPVRTAAGSFAGMVEDGLRVFRGIRYGSARRFEAPRAAQPPAEIQPADRFAAPCPQNGGRAGLQDEDCLFLNVWTPEANPRARLPVMVYFHGGAYSNGSAADPLTHGHALAARGEMVVVTVNHRLNILGYLYLARLDPRLADSGNAGQLDLVLALRWVRDHIAAFGGDPARVTVFGQSGGGAKIATLMGMPAAAGLFHRAATMSGQQVTVSGPLHATERARAFLAKAKVPERSPGELADFHVGELMDALAATEDPYLGGSLYMGPVLDMKWLARHPFWPDAHPQSRRIPMLLGSTRDETRAFTDPARLAGLSWETLPARLAPELRIDAHPEWVVAQYRERFPGMSPVDLFYAASTAARSWRGQVIEAEERAKAGIPAWVYRLDFASPVAPVRGAPHGHDVPLVFGTLDAPGSLTGTGAQAQALSRTMMGAFARFARTGDPGMRWPRHTLPRRATMIFDVATRVENDPRKWERELFARIPYVQPGT